MNGKFYLFEGVDFSGKTSLAERLVLRLNAQHLNPSAQLTPEQKHHVNNELSLQERFNFYLKLSLRLEQEISKMLKDRDVVVEKYLYTTMATHSAYMGCNLEVPEGILVPDHIIYLTASKEDLIARREKRRQTTPIHKFESDIDLLQRVDEHYTRLFHGVPNIIRIDTSGKNPDQSYRILEQRLSLNQ